MRGDRNGGRPSSGKKLLPDKKIVYISTDREEDARYLCGAVLRTGGPVRQGKT
ncbi:MAG: hypothetical protein HDT18_08490 [Oscillibacter sp.]|nr:hypothetical protein [Oscillibacter sp.]